MYTSITIRCDDGRIYIYESLEQAILDCYRSDIYSLEYSRFPFYTFSGTYYPGDWCIFIDELGFTIPVWKIHEVANTLTWPKRKTKKYYPEYNPDNFRNGVVPFTRCYRGGTTYWRQPKTTQELRENGFAANYDEDIYHYKVKMRKRRCASDSDHLPQSYDDIHRQYHKNWKYFRKTQWK